MENSLKSYDNHYWKQGICRVQTALPIVKNRALGKELHSAKSSLPSAGHSAKKGTRHRLPRVTVFGHVLLCRVSAVRHSAKFFFENTLPSAPDTALGKEFFFEMSLSSAPVKVLGKEEIFLKKFRTFFAECLILGTRQRPHLLSARPRHSVKNS